MESPPKYISIYNIISLVIPLTHTTKLTMALSGYELSKNYWDFALDNPEKIRPEHAAIYFFAIDLNNRLGWKEKFGFPSFRAMEAVGIKSHRSYMKYFNELVEFGFFELITESKNQFTSCVIALSKKAKATARHLQGTCKTPAKQLQGSEHIDKLSKHIKLIKGDESPAPKSFKLLTDVEFKDTLRPYLETYGKKMLIQFYSYWSEKSASGKMKFQLQATWETEKRLNTWQRNDESWGKPESKPDTKLLAPPLKAL